MQPVGVAFYFVRLEPGGTRRRFDSVLSATNPGIPSDSLIELTSDVL